MNVTVKFLGAARSVTGSRYLLTVGKFRMLFDCGLFQGLKELRVRNWDEFPVDPSTLDAIVISHAHIDHSGYLPKLMREGFGGQIYCTPPTAELMKIMLLDSAKLQEEEAAFAKRKGYSRHNDPQPLYTSADAELVFPMIRTVGYGERLSIHPSVSICYHDAGHLLGSAITEVFIKGESQTKKIIFSGDLGRQNDAMLRPPKRLTEADVLFIESTYGVKDNPATDPLLDLERVVKTARERNGVLLIPAFAVGRTQTLLYYLHNLIEAGRIPDIPVYIDSPMAISTTYLYYRFPEYHKVDFSNSLFARQLETNMLVFVKNELHSKSLNEIKSNAIIISSSGMMTGGRILHHLFHRLRKPEDTVLISGYQAEGTRGRDLVDKKPTIKIFGEEVPVKCHVENMSSLSGHADRTELFDWMSAFQVKPKQVFTVHGEAPGIDQYAQAIRDQLGWNVTVPEYLESFSLFEGI
ncbi:MAG: MBL fold metallo-hydrolase [Cyclobacteriaceae bacterium]